jgi:hypothetical protein
MKILQILMAATCMLALGVAAATGAGEAPLSPTVIAQADTPAAEVPAQESDPEICRTIVPTGSRIGKKVCLRASQWSQMARDGRNMVESTQRVGRQWERPAN